jgi:hypothetical protein
MINSTLRGRLEALLFDGYGTAPYAITVGRFTRKSAELFATDASSERRARVVIGLATDDAEGVNPLDSFALRQRPVVVEIEYQRTQSGEDNAEGNDPLNGAGTDDAIGDRMAQDEHTIRCALLWHEHWAGLDPYVYAIRTDGESETSFDGPVATLRVRFVAQSRDETPGSYGP